MFIQDFSTNIILTSQNSEAFLNFRYDGSLHYIVPFVDPSIEYQTLFVNGLDINFYNNVSDGYFLQLDSTNNFASFHLFTFSPTDFNVNLSFKVYDSSITLDASIQIDTSIWNRPFIITNNKINGFDTPSLQEDYMSSYLLMRSNPKLSGNIKIVIDSSNNLYLDTFPVTNALSNKVFRKIQLSPGVENKNVIGDRYELKVAKVYGRGGINGNLPKDDLFKINDQENFDITSPKRNYHEQYELMYSYGAKLLQDELYDDSFSILAPLWINKKLPDYFAIFKLSGTHNPETYINSETTFFEKYIKDSSIIKSWSLKKNSQIGILLNRYLEEINKNQGPVFLSLDSNIISYENPNSWIGIDVDSGVIAPKNAYNNELLQNVGTYTQLNNYISTKFSAFNSLCPNLLNLEFTFSDINASDYSMNRYFGLYLCENELYKIFYYQENPTDASISIVSLDDKVINTFFNSNIFDLNKDVSTSYRNRIFALTDNENVQRFFNSNVVNGNVSTNISSYINKPKDNIFSVNTQLTLINPFVTFTIENHLHPGEHLRVINKTQNKIWEIFGSNTDLLDAGESWCYSSQLLSENNYPELVRTTFSTKGNIENQTNAIYNAFNSFHNFEICPFDVYKNSNNIISLILNTYANNLDEYVFQRLSAQTRNIFYDASTLFNNAAQYNDISFYTVYNPSENDFETISYDASFGPINFELFGDRKSLMINFMNTTNHYFYSIDSSCYILKDLKETKTLFQNELLYQSNDNWYKRIKDFDVSTGINSENFKYVIDPYKDNKNLLIKTLSHINLVDNKWNAYSVFPTSISLMSINPVKDFDFTVYDKTLGYKSPYWYKREYDNDTYQIVLDSSQSYIFNDRLALTITSGKGYISTANETTGYIVINGEFLFNTFDSSITVQTTTQTTIKHNILNGTYNYDSYKNINEEDVSIYYLNSYRKKLKYNLPVPYIVKWTALGTDCRNNDMRLLLNNNWLFSNTTNYIPTTSNYENEISYPSFKYLSIGEREWQDYIYYDINDTISYIEDNVTYYRKLKDLIFLQPYNDIFSKIIYNNSPNVNKSKTRSTILYYNKIKESLSTIFLGLNINISVNNIAKKIINIANYKDYRFSFISTTSRNLTSNHPIELIINENTKTILMIWYQGNDTLHYNKRFSNTVAGKSIIYDTSVNIGLKGFLTSNAESSMGYAYIKAPSTINTATYATISENVYDIKNNYTSSEISKLAQFSYSYNTSMGYIFNAFGTNSVADNIFSYNKSYNTFLNYVSYLPFQSIDSYGMHKVNFAYEFNNNKNLYKQNTCDYDTLEYLVGLNKVMYYVIKGDLVLDNYKFISTPFKITLAPPKLYNGIYTYDGYYTPKFNNILEFNSNEDDEIIKTVEKDFVLANTNLKSFNNISQLWYNKVSTLSTTEGDNIRYKDFNPFNSQWDAKYYYLEDNSTGYVPGYYAKVEKPSFFGSKLIKLPKTLIFNIDNWNTDTTNIAYSQTIGRIQLSINLTRYIINNFTNNVTFTNNWATIPVQSNNPLGLSFIEIIENYVKETIIPYYNLNKMNVELYIKDKNPGSSYELVNGSNFEQQIEEVTNNELYYYIRFSYNDYFNFDYYVKINILEK